MGNIVQQVKEEIFNVIEDLYSHYNLPPINISDEEWNNFLYIIESHFMANGIMDDYFSAINIVLRRALSNAKVNYDKEVTIENLKEALTDLIAFKINSKQIKTIQDEIDEFVKTKEEKHNYTK